MGENLLSFGPTQKDIFFGRVNEQLNNENLFFSWIPKESAEGGGTIQATLAAPQRRLNFNVHLGRNAVATAQDPEVGFATAGTQVYKTGFVQGRTMYLPASVSVAAIERTRTDAAAFAPVMMEAAERAGNDLGVECERITFGDGSGTLGVVATGGVSGGGTSTLVITLDNYQDLIKFQVGMYLNAWSARTAGATQRQFGTTGTGPATIAIVTALALSTAVPPVATVTMTPITGTWATATQVVAADVFTRANDQNSGNSYNAARAASVRYEPVGLDGICLDVDSPMETGTTIGGLFGINAANGYGTGVSGAGGSSNTGGQLAWQAYVNRSTTARPFTPGLLQSMQDRPMRDYGQVPTHYATSFGGRYEYANYQQSIRRTINSAEIRGGTAGGFSENRAAKKFTEYGDVPVIPSRFCRTDLIGTDLCTNFYAVNMDHLAIKEWYKPRFLDVDGLQWRMIGRTPFFEAILEYTWEFWTDVRIAHAKATSVKATDFN